VPSPLVPTEHALGVLNTTPRVLLSALKEELFALETEHLEGKLSDPEYAQNKLALEVVLRRALARQSAEK
jgi:hypothetical protein